MIVIFGLLVIGALSASAQDDEAPEVVGPEDRPGADVIWKENKEYTLDATGSKDNVGIVSYTWNITAPDDTSTVITSTTPTAKWTPTSPGIYKILTMAEDAEGNKGYNIYAMDVVEVIPAQLIQNTDVSYGNSVAVTGGTLEYRNANIEVTGGRKGEGVSLSRGEQLTESLVFKGVGGGALAGYWGPYNTGGQYGDVYEDKNEVLTGKISLRNSGGSYHYGYMYYFDSEEDLSEYNGLVFWLKHEYEYGRFYYLYMYSGTGYGYRYYYTGGIEFTRGWWGTYFDLDIENVGYGYDYGLDITAVTSIRFYAYGYQSPIWIDCAYFDKSPRGDNITESANPSGDWAGYWSGFTTSSKSFVGSSSVSKGSLSGYQDFYYYFNQPVDLSIYDALKMYTFLDNYYYAYTYGVYFYDSSNRYMQYNTGGSYTYWNYYSYSSPYRWHCLNLPFHDNPQYKQAGFDQTKVTKFRMYVYFPSSSSTVNIDGLEFYKSQGKGTSGPPTVSEDIPHGIYALEDGELKMTSSSFTSPEKWGAFVHCENKLEIKATSFDGLWGTQHSAIMNEGQTYGGVLAFNAPSVILEDVIITKASSSGFYIENSNLVAKDLDLSGVSRDYGSAAGLITAFQGTGYNQKNQVTIENCKFHDSPTGSGLLVLSQDARGDATVDIDGISAYNNGIYGLGIEIVGYTGNLTVSITDSTFEKNGGSGFAYLAHDCMPAPWTQVKFKVEECDALENNGYGLLFMAEKAVVSTRGELINLETYDNSGSGIGFEINKMEGLLDLYFEDVYSHDNSANGVTFFMQQAKFKDLARNQIQGAGVLKVEIESCVISSNEGNGVFDENTATAGSSDAIRPIIKPDITCRNTTIEKNEGHGWFTTPRGRPQYAGRDAFYQFYNTTFSDNDKNGFYIYEYYYNYGDYGFTREHYYFENCSFTYNTIGLEQYWYQSYGTESWVKIVGSTFQDNNYEAIKTWCYWYDYYDCGYSFMQSAEYDIRDSLLDGFVSLDLSGAYDYNKYQNEITAILIGNTYTSDQPMFIRLGQYISCQYPLLGTIIYKENIHTSPSTSDGLRFELYGGRWLDGNVEIEDENIPDALGNGVYVRFGSLYPNAYGQSVNGRVTLNRVNIINPLEDGLFIETWHYYAAGSISNGFYSITNSKITGVGSGVRAANFDGEIRNCEFSNVREQTLYTYFGVIDVFESEIGEISETNLRVDEKGAIRLWFDLRIHIVWRDEPTMPVVGTTVEIKDNSWNILGINTIDDYEGILFTNLNSYSVLPEGIFTRNPYIVTADYIGIVKEKHVEVAENTEITIYMVDDVSPRLTLESPKDGSEQREQDVVVKGTVYDKHTGVDRVEVSIDGVTWSEATLDDERFTYTHTITDIPQGLVLLRVRGIDLAGNSESTVVSILVDNTPPDLDVITPTDGMRTNKRLLEIVGTTDVGSQVYINDQKVDIQYTLISHQLLLAEGPNAIKVASLDYLGNINEVVRYVTLDTQAPYIALVNLEDGSRVMTSKLHIVGLTETEDVTITIGGSVIAVDENGRFEADVMLVDGPNDIEIYGRDSVGNDRLIVVTVTLDQSEPWLKLVEPTMRTLTEKDITVSGFVEMDTRVFVNEREVDVSFGYFETTVSAKEGDFTLTVTAQDVAGNEHTIEVPLLIDTLAPTLDVIFPTEGYVTNAETIEVRGSIIGTENEDSRFLELYINDVPRLFDFNSGDFAQEMLLEEGVNRIRVEGIDPAGNMATLTRTVMLDSKAPYLNVVIGNTRMDPNWNEPVSLSDFVYVYGYSEIGSALTINGVSVEVDSETGYFNYSLDLPPPASGLKISTTDIVVTSLDEAGNSVTTVRQVNRLEGVDTVIEEEASTAEWLILILALVIFGLSFMGAVAYQRIQYQEDVIEAYDHQPTGSTMTPEGTVVAPPPARPARGGRARQKPRSPEPDEEETLDEEEV